MNKVVPPSIFPFMVIDEFPVPKSIVEPKGFVLVSKSVVTVVPSANVRFAATPKLSKVIRLAIKFPAVVVREFLNTSWS